jgi:hypothetical protein
MTLLARTEDVAIESRMSGAVVMAPSFAAMLLQWDVELRALVFVKIRGAAVLRG